jgi:hypothetical protein
LGKGPECHGITLRDTYIVMIPQMRLSQPDVVSEAFAARRTRRNETNRKNPQLEYPTNATAEFNSVHTILSFEVTIWMGNPNNAT